MWPAAPFQGPLVRYATLDNLIALAGERELIQLTDRAEPPTGQVDVARVNEALDSASAEIDSFVGVLYALPLAETPPFLKDICVDLARYRLYPDPTDIVVNRYKAAIDRLTSIAKGVSLIPGASGKSPAARDDKVLTTGPARLMTRASLEGF